MLPGSKKGTVTVTGSSIKHDLEKRLRHGLTTVYAGGFFLLPYHLELGTWRLLSNLCQDKEKGIPLRQLALQTIHESAFGIKRIAELDSLRDEGFDVLSGLPFIVSPATEYRFLDRLKTKNIKDYVNKMQIRRKELGFFNGNIINIDLHSIRTFTKVRMPKHYLTKYQKGEKSISIYFAQDQETDEPVSFTWGYSNFIPSLATPELADTAAQVLDTSFLTVMDSEFCIGSLLNTLDKKFGLTVLVPVRRTSKRVREMHEISLSQYKKEYNGIKIARIITDVKDFTGPIKLIVQQVDTPETLYHIGFLTNSRRWSKNLLFKIFPHRWRIENWFKYNDFFGLNDLPSIELNGIGASLALKLTSYNLMSSFKRDLGGTYARMSPRTFYNTMFRNVHGKAQLKGDTVHISIYGFSQAQDVAKLFMNLNDKLLSKDISPRIPWLNNHKVEFHFK